MGSVAVEWIYPARYIFQQQPFVNIATLKKKNLPSLLRLWYSAPAPFDLSTSPKRLQLTWVMTQLSPLTILYTERRLKGIHKSTLQGQWTAETDVEGIKPRYFCLRPQRKTKRTHTLYSYCYECSVLYILFSLCQLALFGYPDWIFPCFFPSCKANVRV